MKLAALFIPVIVAAGFISCNQPSDSDKDAARAVEYAVYTRYFYRGPHPDTESTMFHWTTTKAGFDSIFTIHSPFGPNDTIPRAHLDARNTVSFTKYSYSMWALDVDTVYWQQKTLFVKYRSSITTPNMTSSVVLSRIIVTPETFEKVLFMENDTTVQAIAHEPVHK